jgi:hypothetical protein
MKKTSKLSTPEWILEGYSSKEEWEIKKGIKNISKKNTSKLFKIKEFQLEF